MEFLVLFWEVQLRDWSSFKTTAFPIHFQKYITYNRGRRVA